MYRIQYPQESRGKVHVGTYLTLHRCTGEAGQRDRQSRLSSTQSTSRIEVRADHSLPNLPYLPVPTLPSTLEHQVCPTVQSSPRASATTTTTTTRCSQPEKAVHPRYLYLAHPIPFSSHPTPAQPTCVHNNPCEIRLGRLTTDDNILRDRSAASVHIHVHVHVPKVLQTTYLT